MTFAQRHFTALGTADPLLSPFLKDAERERPLLDKRGRLHTLLNVDIRGSCRHLSAPAEAVFRQITDFQGRTAWADQPEADVLMAGLVDWHHDHGACFNPLRMLIAFPAIEGFVVDISSKTYEQIKEEDIDALSEEDIKRITSASIPLLPGTVFFLNHDIWHRVRFTGDPAMLDGAPCTFFYDFSLSEEAYSQANAP